MRIWIKKVGAITFRREDYGRGDWYLDIVWGWREDAPEHEFPWRQRLYWTIERPRLIYMTAWIPPEYRAPGLIYAADWTGRDVTIAGVMWRGRTWMWG